MPQPGSSSNNTRSIGKTVNALNDPTITPSCISGLNVALVLDLSASITGPQLAAYNKALTGYDRNNPGGSNPYAPGSLLASLNGTGSKMAFFTFSSTSPASGSSNNPGLLNVDSSQTGSGSLYQLLNTAMGANRSYTNWDAAFQAVADSSTKYDLVLMITDGAPNYSRLYKDSTDVEFHSVENAVLSANEVKAKGTRILGVGVGAGIGNASAAINLAAISGQIQDTDYFLTSDWDKLADQLKAIAQGLTCQVPVVVTKHVTDINGNNPALANGWTMATTVSNVTNSATVTKTPNTTINTGGPGQATGSAEWTLKFNKTDAQADLQIAETQQTNYAVQSATCIITHSDKTTTTVGPLTTTSVTVPGVVPSDKVSCDFVNRPGAVTVNLQKNWVNGTTGDSTKLSVNGGTAVTATVPAGGNGLSTGTATAVVVPGSTVTLAETAAGPATQYTASAFTCKVGSTPVPVTSTGALTGTFTAPSTPGTVNCTITNTPTFKDLTVSKTAAGTYNRTYNWKITKDVDKTQVITTPNGDAQFSYTVTATPNGSTDSGWTMTGKITVTNPNGVAVPVTVTDVPNVGGGANCTVTGGTGQSVPANSSKDFNYSCTFTSQPNYTGGTNKGTVTWDQALGGSGSASSSAQSVAFGLGTETNKTVTVVDDKTNPASPVTLGTATWADGAKQFKYDLTLKAGAAGECNSYTNTAAISGTGQTAAKTVTACAPKSVVSKSVTVNGGPGDNKQVTSGDALVWTLTFENTSSVAIPAGTVLFTDDVSQALAGTDLANALASFTKGGTGAAGVTLTYDAGTHVLTATSTGSGVPGNTRVTVTYGGTVKSATDLIAGHVTTIDNTVLPQGSTTCDQDCTTHNPLTPKVAVSKGVKKGGVDWDGKPVVSGDVLTWTITVKNTTSVPFTGPLFTDDLTSTLAGTTLSGNPTSSDPSVVVTWSSPNLSAAASALAGGATVTVTYTGTVKDQTALINGKVTAIDNTVVLPQGGPTCDQDCTTHNPLTPKVTVSKGVKKGGVDWDGKPVVSGDVLTWTITVKNTTSVPFTGPLFTDDLTSTLAGTTLSGNPTSSDPSVVVTWSSPNLSAAASALAGGATVTVTYTGTVKDQNTLNQNHITAIDNTVTLPQGGPTCDGDCDTHNPLTPKSDVSKSVTVNDKPGDNAQVTSGDVLKWTITVRNTGSVAITAGQLFTDDVSEAIAGTNLGNAVGSFTMTGAGVSLSYDTTTHVLTGTAANFAAGATVTISYTGTVKPAGDLIGGKVTTIDNTVLPTGSTTCNVDCDTHNPLTPKVTVSKGVKKGGQDWDGKAVVPGDVLTWTITVSNTSSVPFTGDLFTDDLTSTLAGTTLSGAPTSSDASVVVDWSSPTLSATASALAGGATVTVTYTGTVKSQDVLNQDKVTTIDNTVVLPQGGPTCAGDCDTHNPLTPKVTVAKGVKKGGVDWDGQQVKPGDVLTWTITVSNVSSVAYTGDLFTDDLTSTLAGTTLSGAPASSGLSVVIDWSSPTLSATANGLAPQAVVTVTYTGTVKSQDVLNQDKVTTIDNTVVLPQGGPTCAGDCDTHNPLTPKVTVAKGVKKGGVDWDGQQVKPGDVLTWTITVSNISSVAYTGALFTDSLASTIAGTTLSAAPASSDASVGVIWNSPDLSASANGLSAGKTVTITYTGTVKSQDLLNQYHVSTIDNTVVLPQGGPTCDGDCDTHNPLTPKSDVSKSVTVNGIDGDGTKVKPGDVLKWTITVRNTGSVDITSGQLFTDDLTSAMAGTDLADPPMVTVNGPGVDVNYAPKTLTGVATNFAAGTVVTVIYTGTVKSQSALNDGKVTTIANTVVPKGTTTCNGDCSTNNPLTPKLTIAKDVQVVRDDKVVGGKNTLVKPGDNVTWTVTVTNVSSVPYTGEAFTDDLTSTLAGVTLAGAPDFTADPAGSVTTSYTAPNLTGSVTDLAAGNTVTLSYSGTVKDQTTLNNGKVTSIDNVVVPPDNGIPVCETEEACTTHNPLTPKVEITKTVAKTVDDGTQDWDGKAVSPNDELTWTITVTNASSVPYTGALFTDDLTSTLAGMDLTGAPTFTVTPSGAVTAGYTAPTLSASANGLAAGASVTITYGGKVKPRSELNSGEVTTIDNVVTTPEGGLPECVSQELCSTDNPITPVVELSKSVTKDGADWNGKEVKPGDVLTWTITAENTSTVPFEGKLFTDDLTSTLAGADLAGAPDFTVTGAGAISYTAPNLSAQTAEALAPGGKVTVSYTGTVKSQDALNKGEVTTIHNVVVPTGDIPTCPTEDGCTTDTPLTPVVELSKSVTKSVGQEQQPWNGKQVKPGDELTWTITVHNTGSVAYTGDLFTDDLTNTLLGVSLTGAPTFTVTPTGSVTASYAAPTLTGKATALEAGATVTVSYTGTVKPQEALNEAKVQTIHNTLVKAGDVPSCPDADGCETDNPLTPAWTVEKSANPASGTAVDSVASGEADHTITYTLTARNTGSVAVSGATALDTLNLPDYVKVTSVEAGKGLVDNGDGTLTWTIPDLAVGAMATATFTVDVQKSAEGHSVVNDIKPTSPNGTCAPSGADEADKCQTVNPVKSLVVVTGTTCMQDAIYLTYNVAPVNVPNADTLPVTVTWRTADGKVARTDTLTVGQLKGNLLWPGVVLNQDGVAIGWPGWRALVASDFPLKAGAMTYGDQIKDPTLATDAYLQPMTVTFSMNPQSVNSVTYPNTNPPGCAVPRVPDLTITKVASKSTVHANEAFDYTIGVKNIDPLGAAYPVTLSDPIPANLKVTGISTDNSGFPYWQACAVTGQDAYGYGGTLNCELSAVLGPNKAAPNVVLSVITSGSVQTGKITNTATVTWKNINNPKDTPHTAKATAVVNVIAAPAPPPLPNTGAPVTFQLWLAFSLLGAGIAITLVTRRRRRNELMG